MLASSGTFSMLFLGLILNIIDEEKVSVAISCRSFLRMTGLMRELIINYYNPIIAFDTHVTQTAHQVSSCHRGRKRKGRGESEKKN